MNSQQTDWVEILRNTIRYRPAVQETAARFKGLSSRDYVDLARRLIDSGEDKALGILLRVCTINAMKLDPVLLAETIKVVEPIDDFSPPYRLQDKSAIAPLLSVAQAKDISWERQAYVGLLAAELAVRFDSDHQDVKRALLKLSSKIRSPINQYMIDQALFLLETKNQDEKDIQFESMRDPLDRLPEEKPPVVTGGTYTVRRTMPKLGRNEPCHCGSGKKYKKCCFEKDQELMRDASPYEGVTMTRARAIPGLVDDAGIIDEMRAYELKKLDPSKLNTHQLYAAFHRAELFGLGEFAFNILLELERRPGKEAFDIGHFEDLLDSALDEGDTVLAEKIMDHVPVESFTRPELIHVCYHLVKDRDRFAGLEAQCRQALTDPDDFMWDDPILHFGHTLEKIYPALSIVFSRASMMGKPDRFLDNGMLLDVIRNARADIGLDPWMDPAEDYFEWTSDQHDRSLEEKNKNQEIEKLTNKASEARIRATDTEKELRERENELQDLAKKLEKEKQSSAAKTQLPESKDPLPEGDRQTVARLRQQIESLKGEVQSQQQTKRQLRHQLRQTQREIIKRQRQSQPEKPSSEQVSSLKPEKSPKKILIPDFTPGFQSSCESMPASIVAKALRASAAFAAHDQPIWRQTTTIKRLPNIYRIRLTIDHRLMIRWQPDERLQVLEIIPRSQLETWIRQHAR